MAFWIGILIGGIFTWSAVRKGFYASWALLFNIIISIYLAIFLTNIIADVIPAPGKIAFCHILIVTTVATASFLILQCISYTLLIGQFSVSFPKILEVLGSGFLGFLTGFLIWSFVSLLICLTPLSQKALAKNIGLDCQSQQANLSYIYWWCDMVNNIVSSGDDKLGTEKVIGELIKNTQATRQSRQATPSKQEEPNKPAEPNNIDTGHGKEKLISTPEPVTEDF